MPFNNDALDAVMYGVKLGEDFKALGRLNDIQFEPFNADLFVRSDDNRAFIKSLEIKSRLLIDIKHGGIDIDGMIEKVIYHDPATIIFWNDGTKTVVKCSENDTYDPTTGFLLCVMKKICGNSGYFNDVIRKHCLDAREPEEDSGMKEIIDRIKSNEPVSKEDLLAEKNAKEAEGLLAKFARRKKDHME